MLPHLTLWLLPNDAWIIMYLGTISDFQLSSLLVICIGFENILFYKVGKVSFRNRYFLFQPERTETFFSVLLYSKAFFIAKEDAGFRSSGVNIKLDLVRTDLMYYIYLRALLWSLLRMLMKPFLSWLWQTLTSGFEHTYMENTYAYMVGTLEEYSGGVLCLNFTLANWYT